MGKLGERQASVRRRCRARWAIGALLLLSLAAPHARAANRGTLVVARIEGMIDLGLVPFVRRVLADAASEKASAVVFQINTFGGRVDAAVAIRDLLLGSRVPTVAFVDKRAISAGALITLAAEKVVIANGGTIGAATPVQMGAPGEAPKATDEKTVSYLRKEFRATADARKRPGLIAEAMVDADVVIPDIIEKGKLLTFTTEDALKHKVADHVADDLPGVAAWLGLADAAVVYSGENWAERVIRFLTHPVVSSMLISLAILGLMVELRTPGFGFAGAVGLLCLVAFFWGHGLVHLVGWEELLLVGAGVLLLALELFVIPGFGVAGVLGILALLAGLTLSLFGSGASMTAVAQATLRVLLAVVLAGVASLVLLRFLPRLPGARKLVLTGFIGGGASAVADATGSPPLVGLVGTALTPLRPAGIATLGGRRVDVVSEGDFIAAGEPVEVVLEAGSRVVVRRPGPKPNRGEQT